MIANLIGTVIFLGLIVISILDMRDSMTYEYMRFLPKEVQDSIKDYRLVEGMRGKGEEGN